MGFDLDLDGSGGVGGGRWMVDGDEMGCGR